jgi:hypothetical protein
MCLIEIAARVPCTLGRALAPITLAGLVLVCAGTLASAQSASDASRLVESYSDGSSYTDYWELRVCVTPSYWAPDAGYYADVGYGMAIPGLIPPAYTDCDCQSQPAEAPRSGYYTFSWNYLNYSDGNNWSLGLHWDSYAPTVSYSGCTSSCCTGSTAESFWWEYWGSEDTFIWGFTSH